MDHQMTPNKKYHYHRFARMSEDWHWCYSARDLQKQLDQLVKGLVLKNMYISFESYMRGKCHHRSHFNLAFVGGYVLLIFDKLAIEFAIHVEGMVKYHFFSPEEIHLEEVYDTEPDEYHPVYENVVELQPCFDAEYAEKTVIKSEVRSTDMWGMHLNGFDTERAARAADAKDLPERICFLLANGVQVQLICDDLEYCHIVVEKVSPSMV